MTDFCLQPVSRLALSTSFAPSNHPAPIDLALDGNEGRAPDSQVLQVLSSTTPDTLRRYPSCALLEQSLASRFGVAPDQVMVTSGADAAIDRCCRMMLEPGRDVIMPLPTFEMLPRYVALSGATLRAVRWMAGSFPLDEVLARVGPSTRMITLVSPNNPTGAVVSRNDLLQVAKAAPHALILLDHAYVEFADEDLTGQALGLANVVVLRTLSKAFGMAGLRVGYAMGHPQTIRWMRGLGQPFSVSGLSLAVAHWRLWEGHAGVDAYVHQVRSERDRLTNELNRLGVETNRSHGNFVLGQSRKSQWLRDGLASLGIAVRIWPGSPELQEMVRITCPGNEESFGRLVRAIRAVLRPQTVIVQDPNSIDIPPGSAGEWKAALEALSKKAKLLVVCNTPREPLRDWLQQRGVAACVSGIWGTDNAEREGLARWLQEEDREASWFIGSGETTCARARQLGAVALVLGNDGEDWRTKGAARVLRGPESLAQLIA